MKEHIIETKDEIIIGKIEKFFEQSDNYLVSNFERKGKDIAPSESSNYIVVPKSKIIDIREKRD